MRRKQFDWKQYRVAAFWLMIIFVVMAFWPKWVYGFTYYVKPTGNDASDGLSIEAAWETVMKGLETAEAGDTIFIADGGYTEVHDTIFDFNGDINAGYRPWKSGNAIDGHIVMKGYNAIPVLTSNALAATPVATAILTGKSYIIFDSIHFNYGWRGIYSESGNNIIIRNCIVDSTLGPCNDNNGGIITYKTSYGGIGPGGNVNNWLMENNHVYQNGSLSGGCCCGDTVSYGNALNTSGFHIYNADNSIIRNNTIDSQRVGIHIKGAKPGGTADSTKDIEIYGNSVTACEESGIWYLHQGLQANISVHHNLLVGKGLRINQGDDDVDDGGRNILAWNNTIIGSGIFSHYGSTEACSTFNNIGSEYSSGAPFGGLIAFINTGSVPVDFWSNNNIGYRAADDYYASWSSTGYSTLTAWQAAFDWDDSSSIADPMFTNPGAGDYTLLPGSPAATGGRGGDYPTYRGAFAPVSETIRPPISGGIHISKGIHIK